MSTATSFTLTCGYCSGIIDPHDIPDWTYQQWQCPNCQSWNDGAQPVIDMLCRLDPGEENEEPQDGLEEIKREAREEGIEQGKQFMRHTTDKDIEDMRLMLQLAYDHIGWCWDIIETNTRLKREGSADIHTRIKAVLERQKLPE